MAAYSDGKSVHPTLAATAVDTVTISGRYPELEITNEAGAATLWVTVGAGAAPADPVAFAAGTEQIQTGGSLRLVVPWNEALANRFSGTADDAIVKVLGNGNTYGVVGIRPARTRSY